MSAQFGEYDIAVIGAGHAGCEAAMAAARLGLKTVIFAVNIDSIANMACNPSIGGTAKGQLVREIDAMGGVMGKMADKTAIQTKLLNKAKGPAVYSPRAQIDRRRYQTEMKHMLELQENIDLKQAEIIKILTVPGENKAPSVAGVVFPLARSPSVKRLSWEPKEAPSLKNPISFSLEVNVASVEYEIVALEYLLRSISFAIKI